MYTRKKKAESAADASPAKRRRRAVRAVKRSRASGADKDVITEEISIVAKRQLHIIVGGRVGDFKIKGVTYCNRQPNILSLEEGQAVMMILDRESPSTNFALHIKTLSGKSLGNVPAEISQILNKVNPRDPAGSRTQAASMRTPRLGLVEGVYPVRKSNPLIWGCEVRTWLWTPPLLLVAAPCAFQGIIRNLKGCISRRKWALLSQKALEDAKGRCFISGKSSENLVPVPWWVEDTSTNKFILEGVVCVRSKLLKARENLLKGDEEAFRIVKRTNWWTPQETEDYIGYVEDLISQREGEGWTLNLKWLSDLTAADGPEEPDSESAEQSDTESANGSDRGSAEASGSGSAKGLEREPAEASGSESAAESDSESSGEPDSESSGESEWRPAAKPDSESSEGSYRDSREEPEWDFTKKSEGESAEEADCESAEQPVWGARRVVRRSLPQIVSDSESAEDPDCEAAEQPVSGALRLVGRRLCKIGSA